MRVVGGPLHGNEVGWTTDVVEFDDLEPGMAYHRTRPTDTNWRDEFDPNWFIKGLPEPVPPAKVYEWHEREWVSPEVAMIRGAIQEAAERFR